MADAEQLLRLCKSVAAQAGNRLLDNLTAGDKSYVHSTVLPREVKATADTVLEHEILRRLEKTGLPILSEERGQIAGKSAGGFSFVVDPLDGTFNFVKGLGPSAVSIALVQRGRPVFGVIFNLLERRLYWGGKRLGAFSGGEKLSVSSTGERKLASVCTGFPVRLDLSNPRAMQKYFRRMRPYAKVRMIGSAAVSLMHVARGSADAYFEDSIAIWDVAAGIALVEGAGGVVTQKAARRKNTVNIFASNGILGS